MVNLKAHYNVEYAHISIITIKIYVLYIRMLIDYIFFTNSVGYSAIGRIYITITYCIFQKASIKEFEFCYHKEMANA
jgi:hypothetical protein